jgi:hypothetical protein
MANVPPETPSSTLPPGADMPKRSLRRLFGNRRGFVAIAVLTLLGVGAFLFTRTRSLSKWDLYQQELAAQGEHLDWVYFIPPAVADGKNFYAAPGMKALFQRVSRQKQNSQPVPAPSSYSWALPLNQDWVELKDKEPFVKSANMISYPVSVVFRWEETNKVLLDAFYRACERPQARLLSDYNASSLDVPNFVNIRQAVQALATLAQAHLAAGKPEKARHDLAGIERLIECLDQGPTLVEAMIRVAVLGCYVQVVREGLEKNAWHTEQLQELQPFLSRTRCLPGLAHSLRGELALILEQVKTRPFIETFSSSSMGTRNGSIWDLLASKIESSVRGMSFAMFREQNLLTYTHLMQGGLRTIDARAERFFLKEAQEQSVIAGSLVSSPKTLLARMAIPNYIKAFQTACQNQTLGDQAALACALELFHRAEGHYPETLAELSPRYMAKLPHDVMTGDPLKYYRVGTGGFKIYGVGWDETDAGGHPALDWVWMGGKEL